MNVELLIRCGYHGSCWLTGLPVMTVTTQHGLQNMAITGLVCPKGNNSCASCWYPGLSTTKPENGS